MVRGIYTATSGLLTVTRDINVRGNNISNVGTAGYKEDRLVTTTFAEAVAVRQEITTIGKKVPMGEVVRGKKALELRTNFEQGSLEQTFRSLDFAISGEGFFTIMNSEDDDSIYYTRNGQFQIDPDGYLIFGVGNYVLDEYGDAIQVEQSGFISNEYGTLFDSDDMVIARLGIFVPENPEVLIKRDADGFAILDEDNDTEALDFTGIVLQGYVERSNTDLASQMSALISNSRSYQSMTQIIKTIDAALGRSISDVGRT